MGQATNAAAERIVAEFLRTVGFGDLEGNYAHVCAMRDEEIITHWLSETQLDAAATWSTRMSTKGHNVYVGPGLVAQPGTDHTRVRTKTCTGLRAYCADIDVGDKGHGKDYVPDIATALSIIAKYPHQPNLVIRSGTGLHLWWIFSEPAIFANEDEKLDVLARWKTIEADLKVLFAEHGYVIDSFADLTHLFRLPGTTHQKTGNVVTILEADGLTQEVRYAPSDFDLDETPKALRSFKGAIPDLDLAVELPTDVFEAWVENDLEVRAVWTLEDPRYTVADLHAPEMSLADRMALAYSGTRYLFSKDEIAVQIRTFRQTHAGRITDPQVRREKLRKAHRLDYLQLTVGKALSLRDPEADAADDETPPAGEIPPEDQPPPTNETQSAGKPTRVEAAKTAKPRGKSQKTLALEIAMRAKPDVFRDQDDVPVCILPSLSAFEVSPITGGGSALNSHMAMEYFAHRKAVLSTTARREVLDHFTALSLPAGRRDVSLRIGRHGDRIFYHLRPGVLIEIGPDGWAPTKHSPIPFRWTPQMQPHGDPPSPGSWDRLLGLWGGRLREEDLTLTIAWMLGAMKPGGPYPLLAIVGPQGSSKSTTAKQVKRIVDPTGPGGIAVYTAPRDRSAEDVFSLARGSHLLVWDNVSTLGDALSDVLSALATGAAAGARKKYSDFDPAETYACRPLALTSIPDAVRRADLRDRMIIVEPLSLEGQHRDEQDVWAETEAAVPPTLGALFTACSAALRHWGGVAGPFFRLADFSRFIMAAELGGAMPWEIGRFAAAYGQNRTAALGTLVAGIAWAEAFVESMFNAHRDAPQEPTLAHSAARILGDLTRGLDPTERQFYPTDPTRLAGELRRIAPALLTVYGLRVEFQRTCGRRRITTSWEEGALARYVSRDPTA